MSRNKIFIVLTMILSLSFQTFDAMARVGGGRSSSSASSSHSGFSRPAVEPQRAGNGADVGMRRPDVMNKVRGQENGVATTATPTPAAVGNSPAPTAAQSAKPGYGVGSMVGAAAAGAAVGYLANSAMHENSNPSNPMPSTGSSDNYANPIATDGRVAGGSGSPWGGALLLLAGTAAIIGVLMFLARRREQANLATVNGAPRRDDVQVAQGDSTQQVFERNALKFFNELQTANNRGDVAYMEENCIEPIRSILIADIQNRGVASNTQVMVMNGSLVDMTEEPGQTVASVLFSGMVSENENSAPDQIREVWHFVKPESGENGWKLAGIEQVNAS